MVSCTQRQSSCKRTLLLAGGSLTAFLPEEVSCVNPRSNGGRALLFSPNPFSEYAGTKLSKWIADMAAKAKLPGDTGGYDQIADAFRKDAAAETAIDQLKRNFEQEQQQDDPSRQHPELPSPVMDAIKQDAKFAGKLMSIVPAAADVAKVAAGMEKILGQEAVEKMVQIFGFDLFSNLIAGGLNAFAVMGDMQIQAALKDIEDKLAKIGQDLASLVRQDFDKTVRTFNDSVSSMKQVYSYLGSSDNTWYYGIDLFFSDAQVNRDQTTCPTCYLTKQFLDSLKKQASDPKTAIYKPIGDRFLEMVKFYDVNCGKNDTSHLSMLNNVKALVQGDGGQGVSGLADLFGKYEAVMEALHEKLLDQQLRPKDLFQLVPAMEAAYQRMVQALFMKYRAAHFYASMSEMSTEVLDLPQSGPFVVSASDSEQDRASSVDIQDLRKSLFKPETEKTMTEHDVVDAFYARVFRRAWLIYSKVYDMTTTGNRLGALQFTVCNKTNDTLKLVNGDGYATFFSVSAVTANGGSLFTSIGFEEGNPTEWRQAGGCSTFTPTSFGVDNVKIDTNTSFYQGGLISESRLGFNNMMQSYERRRVQLNITSMKREDVCAFRIIWCVHSTTKVTDISSGTAELLPTFSRIGSQTPSTLDPLQRVTFQSVSSGNRFSVKYGSRMQHAQVQQEVQVDATKIQNGTDGGDTFQWRLVSNPFRTVSFKEMADEKIVDIVQIQSAFSGYSLTATNDNNDYNLELLDLGTDQGLRFFSDSEEDKKNAPRCWWYLRVERTEEATRDADGNVVTPAKLWYSLQNVKTGKYLNATSSDYDVKTGSLKSWDTPGTSPDSQFHFEPLATIAH